MAEWSGVTETMALNTSNLWYMALYGGSCQVLLFRATFPSLGHWEGMGGDGRDNASSQSISSLSSNPHSISRAVGQDDMGTACS